MTDGLVRRYDTEKSDDGLPPGEGMFLACSFWLVDAYLMIGRREDAVRLFERLLSLRNDLGLLSEQYEPRTRRLVGNFPQAFSHLALVNSASNLAHARKARRAALGTSTLPASAARSQVPTPLSLLTGTPRARKSARLAVPKRPIQGRSHVLLDVRTYKTLPGRVPAQLELYKKYGYPVQLRYMGEPLCYAVAESGELNTYTHVWVYESAADREQKRAKMAQDPDWKVFLAENAKAGNIIEQKNCLMVADRVLAADPDAEDREITRAKSEQIDAQQ